MSRVSLEDRVKKLKELIQTITPGPWYARFTDDHAHMCCDFVSVVPPPAGREGHHEDGCIGAEDQSTIVCTTLHQDSVLGTHYIMNTPNAEFIALVRNTLPDLLKRLEELEEDSEFLGCLSAAGVDNWEGYETAQSMRGVL